MDHDDTDRDVRSRLLLGRRVRVPAGPGRDERRGRVRRRHHPEPDVPGGLLPHDGSRRGPARDVRRRAGLVRSAARGVLGDARPDAGEPPGSGRGRSVPERDLHDDRRAVGGRGGLQGARAGAVRAADRRPRSGRRRSSTRRRTTTRPTTRRTATRRTATWSRSRSSRSRDCSRLAAEARRTRAASSASTSDDAVLRACKSAARTCERRPPPAPPAAR